MQHTPQCYIVGHDSRVLRLDQIITKLVNIEKISLVVFTGLFFFCIFFFFANIANNLIKFILE